MTVVGATALLATALSVMAIAAVAACAVSISHWVPLSSERSLKADDCFSLDHFVNSLPLVTRDDGETRSESAKSSTSVFSATGRAWTICRWRPSSARSLTEGVVSSSDGKAVIAFLVLSEDELDLRARRWISTDTWELCRVGLTTHLRPWPFDVVWDEVRDRCSQKVLGGMDNDAARTDQAKRLRDERVGVCDVLENLIRRHRVESLVGERNRPLDVCDYDVDPVLASHFSQLFRYFNLIDSRTIRRVAQNILAAAAPQIQQTIVAGVLSNTLEEFTDLG